MSKEASPHDIAVNPEAHGFARCSCGQQNTICPAGCINRPVARRVGPALASEAEHFMECGSCGQAFDMRDLGQVFYHEEPGHKPMARD